MFNSILKHCLSFIKSFPKTSLIFEIMNTLLGSTEAILETLILSAFLLLQIVLIFAGHLGISFGRQNGKSMDSGV